MGRGSGGWRVAVWAGAWPQGPKNASKPLERRNAMEPFRLRLILALVVCVTAVSMASTYFDVLAHRHILREELERRAKWMGMSVLPEMEQAIAGETARRCPYWQTRRECGRARWA